MSLTTPYRRIYEAVVVPTTLGKESDLSQLCGAYGGGAARIRLRVVHESDGKGGEKLDYLVGGVPFTSFVLDPEVGVMEVLFVEGRRQANLHPLAEAAALPSVGYFVPPEESRLFAQVDSPFSRTGELCQGTPGCLAYGLRHSILSRQVGLTSRDGVWKSQDGQGIERTWRFGGTPPREIFFKEVVAGASSAATWRLVSDLPYQGKIGWRDEISKRDQLIITKNGKGFGAGCDPNMRDPWKTWDVQAGLHRSLERRETLPLPSIGLAVLLIVAVALVARKVARRGRR